ncbi:hypothetical protein E5221_23435 [Pseudomonas sp. A2]|nr:hypothetical protein E5221_23435 [Pseudomonas sp. A2]
MPASSRVNPLPQVLRRSLTLWCTCGSGFTREEAGTGDTGLVRAMTPMGSSPVIVSGEPPCPTPSASPRPC